MAQIGNHPYDDSTPPLDRDTGQVGKHGFAVTDNRGTPCNGLTDCDEDGEIDV